MQAGDETTLMLQALAAVSLLVLAFIMIVLTMRSSTTMQAGFIRTFLKGEGLSKRGETFRLIGFLSIMFAFINIVGTVVFYITLHQAG